MESFKIARQVGISLAEFDEMTPRELNMCIEVFSKNVTSKAEEKLHLEWVNAYWQRVDILKPFHEMIGKPKEEKEMSDIDMLVNVEQLNALFGGSVEK